MMGAPKSFEFSLPRVSTGEGERVKEENETGPSPRHYWTVN